jgi:hypothetical protein
MTDAIRDVFGPPSDPLKDVFGTPPNPDFTTDPLRPKPTGPLAGAVQGKSPTETEADRAKRNAVLDVAKDTPGHAQNVPSYLAHGLESGLYAAGGMLGDAAEAMNPVTAARDAWLTIADTGRQLISGSLVGDKEAHLRSEAAKGQGSPFTRFAERMQQQSAELGQTPDGQKYNDLRYATTDPAKSALLSPVRMVHDMLQSLPSTAAMATTVFLTRGAAAKAYSEAMAAGFTREEALGIATKAAGKVAALAGAGGEGVVGGLQQDEQTRVQVLQSNPAKSPVYQAMIRAGIKPAEAKQFIASQAGALAGIGAGTVDAITNLAEGPILGKIISEGGPLAARVGKGFLAEGIQEGVQGAGEQVSQNAAVKMYADPQQQLGDQVAENVLASFAVGGLTGGLFAGVGGGVNEEPKTPSGINESEAMPTLDGIKQEFGPELAEVTPQGPKPSDDTGLGRNPVQQAPKPGRQYNVADAIAELGMSPEEAKSFVKTGSDPRKEVTLEQHGFTGNLTPEDVDSPIPDSVIIQGKDLLAGALEDHKAPKVAISDHATSIIANGLISRGIIDHVARGAAAGAFAESRGDAAALNPDSGALGIGQWLGSRKAELIRRYGPNPTLEQQLDFLAYELKGGDHGGKSVLSAQNEDDALNRYIHDFMRPAAGKETEGDIKRGRAVLGLGDLGLLAPETAGTATATSEAEAPKRETLKVEDTLPAEEPATEQDIAPGKRLNVTQNDATTGGTVEEVYGEGKDKGVRIKLDDGTTFDERLADAQEYGAKLTVPKVTENVTPPEAAKVEVPDVADPMHATFGPKSYAGEPIDNEFTAFHPDTGTLGIPRAEMPQIKQEDRGAFVNFAEARGITHEEDTVPADSLKPSQIEFAPTKVDKFLDNDAGVRSVLVSKDGYVLDGHHQWVAALDKGTDVRVIRLNAPIRDLIRVAHDFPSSQTSSGATPAISPADKEQFAREDIHSVIDARGTMNASYNHEERAAFSMGARDEIGLKGRWDNVFRNVDLKDEKQKVAYNKGRAAAVKELKRRGVTSAKGQPAQQEPAKTLSDTALDYDTTERHDRADWLKAAGVTQKMLPGDRAKTTGTPFSELPREVQTRLHEHKHGKAEAKPVESTAPEHAAVGVDDRELSKIVDQFNAYQQDMFEGGDEQITHVFDAPKKGEIVRLNEKSRVYHKEHGWMTPKEAAAKIREWEDVAVKQGQDGKARSRNGDRVVLSLFDLSGEWSLPWEQAGYQVYRFDIQADFADFEGDGINPGDVNNFSPNFFGDWFGDFEGLDIYAILAACPCTDFASSGARHFAAKDKDGRTVASVKLVHQTLAAIEYFKPAVWALENPVGRIEKLGGLPPWRMSFDPNDLGDPYTKKTLLWGRFNADLPVAPVEPTEGSKMHTRYGGKSLATKNARSVTPEGFSYGFFVANNAEDHPVLEIAGKYDRLDRGKIERAVAAGVTKAQIDEAVQDFYYQDLDDEAANNAIADLIVEAKKEPVADQPSEAPINEAAAEALRTEAEPFQQELAAWGKGQAKDGVSYLAATTKGVARMLTKMKEGYKSLRDLKDIVRGAFVVDEAADADSILASIKSHFDKFEDKGWKAVDGYKYIVQKDGIKGEIQIIPAPIAKAKEELHEIYAKWREIPGFDTNDAPPEARELERQMIEGYAKAASGTSWASAFKEAMAAYAARNSFAKSVWDKLEPTFLTSPEAGTQSSPSNTNANPRPSETPLATGRPSISLNDKSAAIGSNVGNAPAVSNVSYGASNKIVTRDQAEIARAIIRNKLKNQLNSGFDPELLSAGMQLAAFHLEAGARQFAAFAKAVADDLGTTPDKLKLYLGAWYNGAKSMLEAHGADVSDMDSPDTVKQQIQGIEPPPVEGDIVDNGGNNAGSTTEQGAASPDRTGDAGQSAGDVSGAEGDGRPDAGAASEGGPSRGELPASDGGRDQPGAVVEPQSDGRGRGERDNAGSQRSGTNGNRPSRRVRDTASGTDFRAARGALERTGSWLDTANRNLDIIELVNKLDAEGRPATPDEQALLAKWTGWGASEMRNKLFSSVDRQSMTINKPYYTGEWEKTIERARELIKGDDLKTAMQSVQYAHYTSEDVIRSMWATFERMGFEGGKVLEPGMGVGHFFTAAPDNVAEHSTYTGIELDNFSAKVAKYLLPQENVIQGDYTKQAFPDGFFDVAIGNPPFSATKVLDDPAYKKMRLSLHNYFFVKTLDKVRPGGLVAFVTSRYTMDSLDSKQRQLMADRADLVGAVRLPQTAFKKNAGTEVVTDILFFQRRMPGAEPGGEAWLKPADVTVAGQKANINEYFKAHPEMVLGKFAMTGTMYSKNELTVEPHTSKGSIEKQLGEALGKLPGDIYTTQPRANVESLKAKTFERDFAPAHTKEGGVYVKDGKVLVVDHGSGVPVEAVYDKLKPNDHAWLKDYTKLRDLLKDAQKAQLQDLPEWEAFHDALKKEYARFTKKHGRIKDYTATERTETDEDGNETTIVYRRFKWRACCSMSNRRWSSRSNASPTLARLKTVPSSRAARSTSRRVRRSRPPTTRSRSRWTNSASSTLSMSPSCAASPRTKPLRSWAIASSRRPLASGRPTTSIYPAMSFRSSKRRALPRTSIPSCNATSKRC